jgi:formiminotetrahydrofolate cyclodeaminase
MSENFADFVALLAAPKRSPAGIAAAAAGAAMALALMERALAHPNVDAAEGAAPQAAELVRSLRRRVQDVVTSDLAAEAALDEALSDTHEDADARQAGARVPAYRGARRLIDCLIQALTLLKPTMDLGNRGLIADFETAWRLLATALEAAIASCEQHLLGLSSFFVEAERPGLIEQAIQGREWVERASGELSWRLGHR